MFTLKEKLSETERAGCAPRRQLEAEMRQRIVLKEDLEVIKGEVVELQNICRAEPLVLCKDG